MSATSVAGVVFGCQSFCIYCCYANMTRHTRIDARVEEYIESGHDRTKTSLSIKVHQSILLMMPPVTGKVNVGNK